MNLEITMTEENEGYCNLRTLLAVGANYSGRLTHLAFLPDPAEGHVIMVPVPASMAGVDGVEALKYSATENGATVNLRLALLQMKVERKKGRVISFPIVTRTAPNGVDYMALNTKALKTRPSRTVKKDDANAETQGTTQGQSGPNPGEVAATEQPTSPQKGPSA